MEKQGVIIKKIKKGGGHGGHHGGSWKVAYADFVTAMMAFFLLMWLVTAKKMVDKVGLAEYFKSYTVTDSAEETKEKVEIKIKQYNDYIHKFDKSGPSIIKPILKYSEEAKKVAELLRSEIQMKLADVSNQVLIEATPEGAVNIQLMDNEGKPMFAAGSSDLNPMAKQILAVIWDKIRTEEVKIAIEGHTDAYQYGAAGKTNWELSTERASAARKYLEGVGLPSDHLLRVTGLADTKPISNDRFSPINRRISLILYYYNPDEKDSSGETESPVDKTEAQPGKDADDSYKPYVPKEEKVIYMPSSENPTPKRP